MLYLPNQNDEIRAREYSNLVSSINEWLVKTSDGRLSIVNSEVDEDEGQGRE